jgi:hypothetical protein
MCEHKISLILFDEEMTCGLSIFTYPVFGLGRASTEGITRPIKITAWRGSGLKLDVQGKDSTKEA